MKTPIMLTSLEQSMKEHYKDLESYANCANGWDRETRKAKERMANTKYIMIAMRFPDKKSTRLVRKIREFKSLKEFPERVYLVDFEKKHERLRESIEKILEQNKIPYLAAEGNFHDTLETGWFTESLEPEYYDFSQDVKASIDKLVKEATTGKEPRWLEPVYFKGLKILPGLRGSEYLLSLNACIDSEDKRIHRQMMDKYVKAYTPEEIKANRKITKALEKEFGMFWYYDNRKSFCFAEHTPYQENIAEQIKEFKANLPKAVELFIKMFYIDDKPKVEKLLREGVAKIIKSY